jgi:hypothetical protein
MARLELLQLSWPMRMLFSQEASLTLYGLVQVRMKFWQKSSIWRGMHLITLWLPESA